MATLHGFVAIFLEEYDGKSHDRFNEKLQTLHNYISFRKLPKVVGDAIVAQYTHMWRKVKSTKAEKNQILSLLSESTAMDLSLFLQSAIMDMVPMIRDLPLHTRRRIALVLQPQIIMPDTYVYCAGDEGQSVYFVSHGSVKIELNTEPSKLDARGVASLQILLHKHTMLGDIHRNGDHFGEYCLVSEDGLRADSAKALTGTELYALSKLDLWAMFQYLTYAERRQFVFQLMTRAGSANHVDKDLSPMQGTEEDHTDDGRIKYLFRLTFEIMTEIIQELDHQELRRSRDCDSIEEADVHRDVRKMLRNHSKSGQFSQRDLLDLFDLETATGNRVAPAPKVATASSLRLNFSAGALRSRMNSFNSAEVIESMLSGDDAESNELSTPIGSPKSWSRSASKKDVSSDLQHQGMVQSLMQRPAEGKSQTSHQFDGPTAENNFGDVEMVLQSIEDDEEINTNEGAGADAEKRERDIGKEIEKEIVRSRGRSRTVSIDENRNAIEYLSDSEEDRSADKFNAYQSPLQEAFNQRRRSRTNSLGHQRGLEEDIRNVSPAVSSSTAAMSAMTNGLSAREGLARSGSGGGAIVRFELESLNEVEPFSPPVLHRGLSTQLKPSSVDEDFQTVRNAQEIEMALRGRRTSSLLQM
jgi:CRP-like cAMP-binding protein